MTRRPALPPLPRSPPRFHPCRCRFGRSPALASTRRARAGNPSSCNPGQHFLSVAGVLVALLGVTVATGVTNLLAWASPVASSKTTARKQQLPDSSVGTVPLFCQNPRPSLEPENYSLRFLDLVPQRLLDDVPLVSLALHMLFALAQSRPRFVQLHEQLVFLELHAQEFPHALLRSVPLLACLVHLRLKFVGRLEGAVGNFLGHVRGGSQVTGHGELAAVEEAERTLGGHRLRLVLVAQELVALRGEGGEVLAQGRDASPEREHDGVGAVELPVFLPKRGLESVYLALALPLVPGRSVQEGVVFGLELRERPVVLGPFGSLMGSPRSVLWNIAMRGTVLWGGRGGLPLPQTLLPFLPLGSRPFRIRLRPRLLAELGDLPGVDRASARARRRRGRRIRRRWQSRVRRCPRVGVERAGGPVVGRSFAPLVASLLVVRGVALSMPFVRPSASPSHALAPVAPPRGDDGTSPRGAAAIRMVSLHFVAIFPSKIDAIGQGHGTDHLLDGTARRAIDAAFAAIDAAVPRAFAVDHAAFVDDHSAVIVDAAFFVYVFLADFVSRGDDSYDMSAISSTSSRSAALDWAPVPFARAPRALRPSPSAEPRSRIASSGFAAAVGPAGKAPSTSPSAPSDASSRTAPAPAREGGAAGGATFPSSTRSRPPSSPVRGSSDVAADIPSAPPPQVSPFSRTNPPPLNGASASAARGDAPAKGTSMPSSPSFQSRRSGAGTSSGTAGDPFRAGDSGYDTSIPLSTVPSSPTAISSKEAVSVRAGSSFEVAEEEEASGGAGLPSSPGPSAPSSRIAKSSKDVVRARAGSPSGAAAAASPSAAARAATSAGAATERFPSAATSPSGASSSSGRRPRSSSFGRDHPSSAKEFAGRTSIPSSVDRRSSGALRGRRRRRASPGESGSPRGVAPATRRPVDAPPRRPPRLGLRSRASTPSDVTERDGPRRRPAPSGGGDDIRSGLVSGKSGGTADDRYELVGISTVGIAPPPTALAGSEGRLASTPWDLTDSEGSRNSGVTCLADSLFGDERKLASTPRRVTDKTGARAFRGVTFADSSDGSSSGRSLHGSFSSCRGRCRASGRSSGDVPEEGSPLRRPSRRGETSSVRSAASPATEVRPLASLPGLRSDGAPPPSPIGRSPSTPSTPSAASPPAPSGERLAFPSDSSTFLGVLGAALDALPLPPVPLPPLAAFPLPVRSARSRDDDVRRSLSPHTSPHRGHGKPYPARQPGATSRPTEGSNRGTILSLRFGRGAPQGEPVEEREWEEEGGTEKAKRETTSGGPSEEEESRRGRFVRPRPPAADDRRRPLPLAEALPGIVPFLERRRRGELSIFAAATFDRGPRACHSAVSAAVDDPVEAPHARGAPPSRRPYRSLPPVLSALRGGGGLNDSISRACVERSGRRGYSAADAAAMVSAPAATVLFGFFGVGFGRIFGFRREAAGRTVG
ncbi:hypothetical protein ACHAWF_016149 [Thalassiosira exigua]